MSDVAVVIPVGSLDPILEQQVRAVLGQLDEVAPAGEVVLSVNSPDAALRTQVSALVDRIAHPRLRTIDSSERRGAAHARNAGARSTECELLAFCDADDLVHPDWLGALVRGLDGLDAVSGRVVDVFPDERTASWYPAPVTDGLLSFLGAPYLLSGNLAVRRDAFVAVGGFDEDLTRCEDIAFSWALVRAGHRIGYAADAVIDYRRREGIRPMLRQHYLYGRGMSEVLKRYGAPDGDGWVDEPRRHLLRANGQRAHRRTGIGTVRRAATALGRLRGLATPAPARTGSSKAIDGA